MAEPDPIDAGGGRGMLYHGRGRLRQRHAPVAQIHGSVNHLGARGADVEIHGDLRGLE